MSAGTVVKRRGFRKAPAGIRNEAEWQLGEYIDADAQPTLAVLRPAVYCGPGSAGDRGAWVLVVSFDLGGPAIHMIELDGIDCPQWPTRINSPAMQG